MHTKVQWKGNVIASLQATLKSIHISFLAINSHLIAISVVVAAVSCLVRNNVPYHREFGGRAGRLLRVVVKV